MYASSEGAIEDKPLTRAQKKNARKKQKKKEKASELLFEVEEITSAVEQASLEESSPVKEPSPRMNPQNIPSLTKGTLDVASDKTVAVSSPGDNLKRIRALRKKLKQIEDLENRIASGEITKPDQDQLNKIAKKEEFSKELEELAVE